MAILFNQCRVACDTGIMPKEGSFENQEDIFCEVFPHFVARWKDRFYAKIWLDVRTYTEAVLKSIFPKKGAK